MAKSAKVTKKEASDSKARGKGIDPKMPVTKNKVKALLKTGKGK